MSHEHRTPGGPQDGGLVSATLAQLYLEQGHPERALAICHELLERDPTNGHALVLERRMRTPPPASLHTRFVSSSAAGVDVGVGQLELSWSIPRSSLAEYDDARLDVVVAIARQWDGSPADDGPPVLRYTSVRCLDLVATHLLDVPLGPASAASVLLLGAGPRRPSILAEFRRRPDLRILAVAEPVSW